MATTFEEEQLEESEDTMEDLYIIFFIDGREYGIEIRYLIEIIAFQPVTFVPNLPEYVKGVLSGSQAAGDKFRCREGKSPDRRLRSQNPRLV